MASSSDWPQCAWSPYKFTNQHYWRHLSLTHIKISQKPQRRLYKYYMRWRLRVAPDRARQEAEGAASLGNSLRLILAVNKHGWSHADQLQSPSYHGGLQANRHQGPQSTRHLTSQLLPTIMAMEESQ